MRQLLLTEFLSIPLFLISACTPNTSSLSSPSQENRALQPQMQFYINQLSQEESNIVQSMLPAINEVEHVAKDRSKCLDIVNPVSGASVAFKLFQVYGSASSHLKVVTMLVERIQNKSSIQWLY